MKIHSPCVYLVGAGPGDPDLLTIRALRLIENADVIVYDRLISDEILELIPDGIAKIYVGKAPGKHSLPQLEINQLLVKLAKKNRVVVRLKGGDPFMYGRGGEEALELVKHKTPFEVVPGITAASACTTYAGIPLTHRGVANRVQFVTGHCQAGKPLDLYWKGLIDPELTVAIYMGLANLPQIVSELTAAGRAAETPAAIIENGACTNQRTLITTLGELAETVRKEDVHSPALIVIGHVVELADQLSWFATDYNENQDAALNHGT